MKKNKFPGRVHSFVFGFVPHNIGNRTVIRVYEFLRKIQRRKHLVYGHYNANAITFRKHVPFIKNSGGFISGQSGYDDMNYGDVSVAYAGCGVIAVYNVLNSFGRSGEYPLPELIREFESDGMVFSGKLGTSPLAAFDFFIRCGYTALFSTDISWPEEMNDMRAYIITVYNDRDDISRNIHSFAVVRTEKGYCAYNSTASAAAAKKAVYSSAEEFMAGPEMKKTKTICIVGIN